MQTFILTVAMYSVSGFLEILEFCFWVMLQDLYQCFCLKVSFLQQCC